jgi:HTH-type transcriptional regulator/antitoxin MqsA
MKQINNENEVKRSCPECDSDMVRGTRTTTVKYGGLESEPFDQPGLWCQSCGEGLLSFKDMEVSTREMHVLKARAEHLLEPNEVKRVRKKLGLTQKEAGLLLGGGPNAFQKYESADVVTSQAISNLLRLLAHDPSGLEVLRHEITPRAARASKAAV